MWSIVCKDNRLFEEIVPLLKERFDSSEVFIEDLDSVVDNASLLNSTERKLTIILTTPHKPYFYIQDNKKNIIFTNKDVVSNGKKKTPIYNIRYSRNPLLVYKKVILDLVKKYEFNDVSRMRLQTYYDLVANKAPIRVFFTEEFDDSFPKYKINISNEQLLKHGFIHFPLRGSTKIAIDEQFYKNIYEAEDKLAKEKQKRIAKEKRISKKGRIP